MCELLGMSSSCPADLCFSFSGLRRRGGAVGPHADGWGAVFYLDDGLHWFREEQSCHDSALAALLCEEPIRASSAICHIRQANVGDICLENTHPFVNELWGQHWALAHNGQLYGFKPTAGVFQAVGVTDSEALFVDLLNRLVERFEQPPELEVLIGFIADSCAEYLRYGVCNLLIGNGDWLFSLCSTRLASVSRRFPFGNATLRDQDLSLDIGAGLTRHSVITVLATEPLTQNEDWTQYRPGMWQLWRQGEVVLNGDLLQDRLASFLFRLAV